MADSILRLKVDSQEYDQKIRRAAEGIQQYAQKCREAGGTLEHLDDGVLEFVHALGQMDTVATSTKQQLREMSNAITTLTQTYRELSDEEKQSGFGQELNKQIQILTERAGKAKDAMMDVEASIRNAASDTRVFDQLSQGASIMTAGFQGLTGAGKLLGIEMGNDVEVIAKLQAAMAVTNSLTTIQTALQKQSALMQGVQAAQTKVAAIAQRLFAAATGDATKAQAAFNAVSQVNPYVMLASAVTAVSVALFAFSSNAKKATEATNEETEAMKQATRMADIWKQTMGSTYSSLMTKYDELKRQWQALASEHAKTAWIKKNQTALHDLGGAVNDVKSAEDFFNNNTDAVVQSFVRRAQAAARVAQLTELYRKQIELLDKKSQASAAITADAQNSGRSAKEGDLIPEGWTSERYGKIGSDGKWRFTKKGAALYSGTDTSSASSVMKIDVEIEANQSEIEKVKNQITNEFKDVSVVGSGNNNDPKKTQQNEQTELQQNQKKINDLTQQYVELSKNGLSVDDEHLVKLRDEIKELEKRNGLLSMYAEQAQGRLLPQNIDLSAKGVNRTMFGDLGITSKPKGLDKPAQLDEKALKAVQKNIQKQTDLQIKELKESKKEDKSLSTGIGTLAGGMTSVVGGLEQLGIEIPDGFKSAISAMQGISSILTGIAATVLAIEAIAGADAIIPFTKGGVVPTFANGGLIGKAAGGMLIPGNSFSGDNLRMPVDGGRGWIGVNSGELILSKSQQNNLVNALTGEGMNNIRLEAVVSAEQILLASNNRGRRTGRGELVQSNRRR